jgi:matrix metalloproteinase-14 (membrane-inserted)
MVTKTQAAKYLEFYGYDEGRGGEAAAVKRFQREYGTLKVDGKLGDKTIRAMSAPRCGCTPEMLRMNATAGALQKWPDRDWQSDPLLYGFERFVSGISQSRQRELAKAAVDDWNRSCGIHAREVSRGERADVVISTGNGRRDGFDGPGRTLAWAYLAGGLMRFDEAETWVEDGNGILWRNVFSHEWGHIIGIGHSKIQSALMAPFYSRNVAKPQSPDDVENAVQRYGSPSAPPADPDSPPATAAVNFSFDANVYEVVESAGRIEVRAK